MHMQFGQVGASTANLASATVYGFMDFISHTEIKLAKSSKMHLGKGDGMTLFDKGDGVKKMGYQK